MTTEDAKAAVDQGAKGLIVSDHGGGPVADLALHVFFADSSSFMNHGVLLRAAYNAGSSFGLAGGYGFATTLLDAAYTIRFNCPCMSSNGREWYASAPKTAPQPLEAESGR